jgi:hypothetical protein
MSGGYEGPELQLRALTSWGWRCSAAGGSLRAILGRYATCGRPVLCSAGRGRAGGQVRVAPKTGGFRCLSTADGGLWSGPKVAKWIRDRTGKSCCNHTGWMYLKRLGCTVQRPRPEQPDANKEDQEVFKRGDLPIEFEALLTRIPTP